MRLVQRNKRGPDKRVRRSEPGSYKYDVMFAIMCLTGPQGDQPGASGANVHDFTAMHMIGEPPSRGAVYSNLKALRERRWITRRTKDCHMDTWGHARRTPVYFLTKMGERALAMRRAGIDAYQVSMPTTLWRKHLKLAQEMLRQHAATTEAFQKAS